MKRQKWDQAAQTPIDKGATDEIEEEAGVRYKMRERSKWQKKLECCIFERRIENHKRAKPIPRPGRIFVDRGVRAKKAFLTGAERKLRSAVRREKAQYLHEREAQNPDGELARGADAAR